jgi:hypothetical protein
LVDDLAATDIVTPEDVLDHRALGYCYDDEPDCPCPPVKKREAKEKIEIKERLPKELKESLPNGIPPLARTRSPYAALLCRILSSSKSAGLI